MSNELITVLTFNYAHELSVARGLLESEGIYVFAKDEFINAANPFYSNAVGGVKLQVREEDLERAVQLLKEAGFIKE